MNEPETRLHQVTRGAGWIFGHGGAVVGGLLLMLVGLAMGVTMLMLPIGIVTGLLGLAIFFWGLFGRTEE
jgi:hypothetical protein